MNFRKILDSNRNYSQGKNSRGLRVVRSIRYRVLVKFSAVLNIMFEVWAIGSKSEPWDFSRIWVHHSL